MADQEAPETPQAEKGGNTLLLIVSWLWVGVPLAWGVLETLWTSMALWR